MRLGWKKWHLSLNFGQVTMVTQLVDGTFPNPDKSGLIPTEFTAHVTFLAEDLYRVLQGMVKIAHEGSGIVRLEWADRKLTAGARGDKAGNITMVIPATCEGEGHIAFNLSYPLVYVKGKQGMARMSVAAPSAPALFTYRGKANHVIMPLFVQWEGTTPPPAASPSEAQETEVPTDAVPEGPDDAVYLEEPPTDEDQPYVPWAAGTSPAPPRAGWSLRSRAAPCSRP